MTADPRDETPREPWRTVDFREPPTQPEENE